MRKDLLLKKYISRTDLKESGFGDLFFCGNLENGSVSLKASSFETLKNIKYKVFWSVSCDRLGTSARNIERLCRLMIEEYTFYNALSEKEKEVFVGENGIKI
jgi:hypothetical protein